MRQQVDTIKTSSDNYLMDGHKLFWHLDRVNDWLNGNKIPPIHIDVGLSKGCNIRCHYCYGATQGNLFKKGTATYFPKEPLLRYMRDAGEVGVRSMAIIGEAEPLLNPHVYDAIVEGKRSGVDMSMGTNGILFDKGPKGEEALEHLTWLRFNISAASEASYKRLHGSNDFNVLIDKIKFCVNVKKKKNLPITIGFQMVLTPQDVDEVVPLARLGKELGIDYLEVKHCGDTVDNALGIYKLLDDYDKFQGTLEQAEAESSSDYRVIIKWRAILSKGRRDYDRCYGPPFLIYSSGDGKLYPCGMFFSYREEEFCFGDLKKNSFKDIINSQRYWDVIEKVKTTIDVHNECYANCRTNAINSFLWKLKNPPSHVNFI